MAALVVLMGLAATNAAAVQWFASQPVLNVLLAGGWLDDTFTITQYDVDATIHDDGSVTVVENIWVDWHEPRRGLFRDLELEAADGSAVGLAGDVEVRSDTYDELPLDTSFQRDPPRAHLEMFDAQPRAHRDNDHFQLAYTFEPGMVLNDGGVPTFRWDPAGLEWPTTIEQLTVRVGAPGLGFDDISCRYGRLGDTRSCPAPSTSSNTARWAFADIPPYHGSTINIQLDPHTTEPLQLARADLPTFGNAGDAAVKRWVWAFAMFAVAGLALLAVFPVGTRKRHLQEGMATAATVPVIYQPPNGMHPAEAAVLYDPTSSDYTTTAIIADLAVRDVIDVAPSDKDRDLTVRRSTQPTDNTDEERFVRALCPNGKEWTLWNKRAKRSSAHRKLLKELYRYELLLTASNPRGFGRQPFLALFMLFFFVFVLVGAVEPSFMLVVVLAGLTSVLWVRVNLVGFVRLNYLDPVRRDMWVRTAGFRRFLAEAKAPQLTSVIDDPNVPVTSPYLEYLPWAVAFGLGEQWTERFGAELSEVQGVPNTPKQLSSLHNGTGHAFAPAGGAGGGGGGGAGGGAGGGGGGGGGGSG